MPRLLVSVSLVVGVCPLACHGGGETSASEASATESGPSSDTGSAGSTTAGCADADNLGEPCSSGRGACRRDGTYVCDDGRSVCNAVAGPSAPEQCSSVEDLDCDGDPGCLDAECLCGECFECVDAQCVAAADGAKTNCLPDDNPCTRDQCVAASCQHTIDDGAACAGGSCDAEAMCMGPGLSVVGESKWRTGHSVSLGPDVDGDGAGDVLVGMPGAPAGDLVDAGRACLYSGATAAELRCWEGDATEAYFGYTVSLGPDVDGDGKGDALIVAAPDGIGGGYFVGVAYVYSGATGALLHTFAPNTASQFGISASLGPDVDGDGMGDALVGAPLEDLPMLSDAGTARLYSGATGELLHMFVASEKGEYRGRSVSLGPDANGDGRADVLIGGPGIGGFTGRADLYSGADYSLLGSWAGAEASEFFGYGVSLGPDVDGDDRADVLVGAFGAGTGGTAYLYSGATGALIYALEDPVPKGEVFGRVVSFGPDADGDGRGDLIVSSPEAAAFVGHVALYSGATGAFLRAWKGEDMYATFGHSVALGPDFDGDALADLVVGSPGAQVDGIEVGRAYWFSSKSF